jgi:hypothetical protein
VTTPIERFVPVAPDADWESVRTGVLADLGESVPAAWTDHNPADPGVTLAEAAAFGLADLHYRTAVRSFDGWPLEARGWEPDAERHWHATLPPGSLVRIAQTLDAGQATSAAVLEPRIRRCASRADAVALLSAAPWSPAFTSAQRPAVIALMRARLVRQVAQEQAHLIAGVVAAQREAGGPVAVRDARAAVELAFSLPLWEEEIVAVVRRERRRLSVEALLARLTEVRAATAASVPATKAALAADDLSPAEVEIAMAAATDPPGLLPEQLEDDRGRSKVWPPHPIQALTGEPVTADDYARRARAHSSVGRAWAVPGRLAGVAWHGLPVPDTEVDEDAAAVTLVVEQVIDDGLPPDEFLRGVLRTAIGPEAGAPFPDWREDVDDLAPRRVICDEVGAAMLTTAPILVQATLVTGVGVDRAAVVADVRARIAAFFAAGRPETRVPAPEPTVGGPWPRIDQPSGGWLPGDPIRFTETVEAMVASPEVLGVEELSMKVESGPEFVPMSAGSLAIPLDAIPVLANANCLRVRLSLTTECGDA